jgi:hypothetical protein
LYRTRKFHEQMTAFCAFHRHCWAHTTEFSLVHQLGGSLSSGIYIGDKLARRRCPGDKLELAIPTLLNPTPKLTFSSSKYEKAACSLIVAFCWSLWFCINILAAYAPPPSLYKYLDSQEIGLCVLCHNYARKRRKEKKSGAASLLTLSSESRVSWFFCLDISFTLMLHLHKI